MNTRGLVVGTMMLSWATLISTPSLSSATDIRAGVTVEQVTSITRSDTQNVLNPIYPTINIATGRVDSLIYRIPSVPSVKPANILPEDSLVQTTDTIPVWTEMTNNFRSSVNGILSLSSGNTRISVIQSGLKLQYTSEVMKAELTRSGPKIQLHHAFANFGTLNAELKKNRISLGYKHSF